MNTPLDFFSKATLINCILALMGLNMLAQTSATTSGKSPYKNTYVKNVFVTENEFRKAQLDIIAPPSFEKAKEILPVPFWKGHDLAIEMYWKAWELAFKNIKDPVKESGFLNSYIDTAYNGNLFMWDSNFITLFARYGSRAFPFQKTLNNFNDTFGDELYYLEDRPMETDDNPNKVLGTDEVIFMPNNIQMDLSVVKYGEIRVKIVFRNTIPLVPDRTCFPGVRWNILNNLGSGKGCISPFLYWWLITSGLN